MEELKKIDERLKNIESLLLTQKTVLSFNEVALYTGLSKSWLYKLTSTGKISHYKPQGKQIYFEKAELDRWLLRNRIKTNQELETAASTYVTLNERGGAK